jgi:hypothetical protein
MSTSPIERAPTSAISYPIPLSSAPGLASAALLSAKPISRIGTDISTIASPMIALANPANTLIERLAAGVKLFTQVAPFLRQQASLDFSSGKGLFTGASEFGTQVMQSIQLLDQLSAGRGVSKLGANEIGGYGQQLVLNQFKQELFSAAAQQFGLDATSLSVEGVGEMAWNYLGGGTLGSTSLGSASLGGAGASATSGAAEGASVLAQKGGALSMGSKLLGAAGAAYAGYNIIKDWGRSTPQMGAIQGATVGAYIGSIVPGVGTLIGGAIGAVAGGIMGSIHTGKSKDQRARDAERKVLQQIGILDKNWNIRLADGTGYDLGKDGGFKLQNVDGSKRRAYEVDFSNPLAGDVVALLTPLAQTLCGGDPKLTNQFTGYLTNAALSNATTPEAARANVAAFFENSRRALGG